MNSLRALRISGFTFDRLFAFLLFFSSLLFVSADDFAQAQFNGHASALFCAALMFLIMFAVTSRRFQEIELSGVSLMIAAVFALAGAVIIALHPGQFALILTGGILVGIGSTLLFLGWIEVFAAGSISGLLAEVAIASGIAFVLSFLLSFVGPNFLLIVTMVCPLFSAIQLLAVKTRVGETRRPLVSKVSEECVKLEVRTAATLLVFGIAVGILRNYSANHLYHVDAATLDAVLSVSGLVVCAVVLVFSRLADVSAARFLYRLSFGGILLACVLMVASRENVTVAVAIGYVSLQALTGCAIARAMFSTWAFGGSAVRKCALGFGALYLGEFLGFAGAPVLVPIMSIMELYVFVATALIIAHIFLFSEADFFTISRKAASKEPLPEVEELEELPAIEEATTTTYDRSIEDVCTELSAEFQLSPRESEILPGVARGRTIARIQQELFISASTVNTHIRHIYAKCGVKSRQELLDLVDDRLRA